MRRLGIALLCFQIHALIQCIPSAVTFAPNGGRFGDNLYSCSQAYWIHYRYNLPFIFKPFPYSEYLHIHHDYPHYTHDFATHFKTTLYVKSGLPLDYIKDETLYITTFRESPGVDWSDSGFVDAFRYALSPVDGHWPSSLNLDDTKHSIALHVRAGGNFKYDKGFYKKIPLLFCAADYYVQALQLLLCHLEGACVVHIFTDDEHPQKIAQHIKKQLSSADQARVEITYRAQGNNHNAHVLTDFFEMMRFKYLIRSCSHFSVFVEQLGSCVVSIYPLQASKGKQGGMVTQIALTAYGNGHSHTTHLPLAMYGKKAYIQKTKEHGSYPLVPMLKNTEMREILLHPEQRAHNRTLQPTIPLYY
jgi:hypothetical protein